MPREAPATASLRPLPSTRRRPVRPKRGVPADTRARLVEAAAAVFNRDGYHGTDSNRLARAAGYAPATFYKHFPDKRAILLAAYEDWVTAEWQTIGGVLRGEAAADAHADRAGRIVAFVLDHHRRWKGLRASLRALVATDPVARRFHRAQRRRQLEILATMRRGRARDEAAARVDDAVMLFTLERTLDAVAEGETDDLGLDEATVLARVTAIVRAALEPRASR
jgi:AcrR family transcriptional regulator